MNKIDVTDKVCFNSSEIDGEHLPILSCVCGEEFDYWEFSIGIYDSFPCMCPKCGIKLYFRNEIRVFQVIEE